MNPGFIQTHCEPSGHHAPRPRGSHVACPFAARLCFPVHLTLSLHLGPARVLLLHEVLLTPGTAGSQLSSHFGCDGTRLTAGRKGLKKHGGPSLGRPSSGLAGLSSGPVCPCSSGTGKWTLRRALTQSEPGRACCNWASGPQGTVWGRVLARETAPHPALGLCSVGNPSSSWSPGFLLSRGTVAPASHIAGWRLQEDEA